MNRTLFIFALGLIAAGCSQQSAQTTSAPQAPVIVRVVSRDATITARAGENGPVYSVESKSGQTVVSDQTLDQLQANDPKLARHITGMQAGGWAGLD